LDSKSWSSHLSNTKFLISGLDDHNSRLMKWRRTWHTI